MKLYTGTSKRKLSASEPSEDRPKKSKTDVHPTPGNSEAPIVVKRKEGDDPGSCEERSVSDPDEDTATPEITKCKPHDIDGPGPYVFFLWGEGLYPIFTYYSFDEAMGIVLKSAAMDAFNHVAQLPKDSSRTRSETLHTFVHDKPGVKKWEMSSVKGGGRSAHAEIMQDLWLEHLRSGDTPEYYRGWYLVTLQKEEPQEGQPGLEVNLWGKESLGTWWFVGFELSNEEEDEAIVEVANVVFMYDF